MFPSLVMVRVVKSTITIDSFGKVSEVFVTDGGQGYTHGNIQFFPAPLSSESGGPIENLTNTGIGTTAWYFNLT